VKRCLDMDVRFATLSIWMLDLQDKKIYFQYTNSEKNCEVVGENGN
jgi:hypothetical protein